MNLGDSCSAPMMPVGGRMLPQQLYNFYISSQTIRKQGFNCKRGRNPWNAKMLKFKNCWLTLSWLWKDKDFDFTCVPSLGPSITQVDQAAGSLNNLDSMDVQAACQNSLTQAQDSLTPELVSALPDSYLPLAQQEWLDLRIHNSSRWKLPGFHCLTRSEPWNINSWLTVFFFVFIYLF